MRDLCGRWKIGTPLAMQVVTAVVGPLEWSFKWRFSSPPLRSSRVVDRGRTVGTRARGKSGHGIRDRRSDSSQVAFAPFGGYAVSVRARWSRRGRRARRDSRGSAPPPSSEREEEGRSSGEAAESELGSRGMASRSIMGTYAASTALAVQESLPPEGVIVLLACLVGVLTGGSVVLFNLAVHEIHDEVWEGIPESGAAWLRTRPLHETWERLLAVPFGGGVLVGLLNTMRQTLDNDTENDKSKATRFNDVRGILRAFLKAVGAAVTLGTGCSLGPEGPSVRDGS